jgi:AAHS family 4-hydroxybenzoate transporter-like MFS transporter
MIAALSSRAPENITATPNRSVDVDQVLESTRLRGLTLVVAMCAGAVLILDGFDIQVIGFAAPALIADFDIARSELAPALAASLLGMAVGSVGVGALGDRWGRRRALLLSTLLFGSTTLLAATASSVEALAAWRFATGAGLGGALPTATALMAEYSSRRFRSIAIGAALVGVPVGGILGALLAAEVVPTHGWRAIFIIGGALPLLAALVMYFLLPESPRFLATRPHKSAALAALLNRIDMKGRYSSRDRFVLGANEVRTQAGVRALFTQELRWDTMVASLVFLTNIFAVYAFFNWAPLVLTSMGLELATAVRGALLFNVTGVIGALAASWMISRYGSRWPLAAFALGAAAALAWISAIALSGTAGAYPQDGFVRLMAGIAIAGATISAVQVGMYAVAAHIFPTECRASGVGCVLGAGRLGGILSSFAGGVLLARGGAPGFFGGVGAVLLLTLASILLVRRHIAQRPLLIERIDKGATR